MPNLLDRTLSLLLQQINIHQRFVRLIRLGNYFTVVELDDGMVGVCMSSYKMNGLELSSREMQIAATAKSDRLLLRATDESRDNVDRAVRAAVISALSAELFANPSRCPFDITSEFPHHLFTGIKRALVIGCGGLLDYLARQPDIEHIHVSDLLYATEAGRRRYCRIIGELQSSRPLVKFSISDGADTPQRMKEAELVSITGSAFGNGTIDDLLVCARNCKHVIVQGQSATLFPVELFASGVAAVFTTFKTPDVACAARIYDDDALHSLMEGGLPWVYLLPRVVL